MTSLSLEEILAQAELMCGGVETASVALESEEKRTENEEWWQQLRLVVTPGYPFLEL